MELKVSNESVKGRWVYLAAALALVIAQPPARASGIDEISDAVGKTKPIFDTRVRYESVDQEPLTKDSNVSTVRARAGFETGKVWKTALLAEGSFNTPLQGSYRPDNSVPTHTQNPVVADPEAYVLNRLQLSSDAVPDTKITLGRQRILLDDQRFVGNSGWRQTEQTFDALRVVNQAIPKVTVDVSYLNQVNRVFGSDSPQGRYNGDVYLGNLSYQFGFGKLTGFAYLLDLDSISELAGSRTAAVRALDPKLVSTQTYGLRFAGEQKVQQIKLSYSGSYANQENYRDNPRDFSLNYYALELNGSYKQYSLGVGEEILEGDGTVGFSTPLATLHAFQGWADKFLTTPGVGVEDRYAKVGYTIQQVGLFDRVAALAVYHDYQSDRRGLDLGSEVDLQLQAKWQRFSGMLKYALYDAQDGTLATLRDTRKLWAQLEFVW